MGRAGEIRVSGVKDGQVIGMKPELPVLRRGGRLFSSSSGGAQGEVKGGKKAKLLCELECCQQGPSTGGADSGGVLAEATFQGVLKTGGLKREEA